MKPDVVFIINGKETDTVDFGIVPEDTVNTIAVSLLNKRMPTVYAIEVLVDDKDVKIIKYPSQLVQGEKDDVILEYHPTSSTEVGLKANLILKGKYLT